MVQRARCTPMQKEIGLVCSRSTGFLGKRAVLQLFFYDNFRTMGPHCKRIFIVRSYIHGPQNLDYRR